MVVRSGQDQFGTWFTQERNVLTDYRRLFGDELPILGGISMAVDSKQKCLKAPSLFGPITFRSESQLEKES